jgi:hypothetical protein
MARRTNVHDEERSGWPSAVSDDLVQSLTKKFVHTLFLLDYRS